MKDIQTRILEALDAIIEEAELTPTIKMAWANTGHLYAMRGFETLVDVDFAFQDTYCTLIFTGPAVDALDLADAPPTFRVVPHRPGAAFHALNYTDGERINAMLDLMRWSLGLLERA